MNGLGKALCVLCDKELVYGARGQSTLSSSYGLHPVYKEFMLPEKTSPVNSNIPPSDRKTHMTAANKLQAAKQTASYKIQHGLAKGLEKRLTDKLREGFSVLISMKPQVRTFIKC